MGSLLAELKRRNVFRVALAYVIVGWVVLQVAETLAPLMQLPEWTVSLTLYIGIIGFPFALLFAWAFELTPEGLKRSKEVSEEDSITHVTAGHINRLLTLLLLVAIGLLVGERWIGDPQTTADSIESTPVEERPSTETPEADAAPKSIAVLPFVNMSNDPEQDYFSDGISEELLNALAKISELRVAARTSSFSFKGKNQPVPEIGRQLKVETVLEGSVRKSGQRLRITAQLISVADGYHLWSETYDRDLTDIFAIQDEISAAIVDALRVHLDAPANRAEEVVNIQAYNHVLKARHLARQRTESSLLDAKAEYQKALELEPTYAAAWAGKALTLNLLSTDAYGSIPQESANAEAQSYIDRALHLDPKQGLAHAVQGLIYLSAHRNQAALDSFEKAIQQSPNEGVLYTWKGLALFNLGRAQEAINAQYRGYEVDPLVPIVRRNYLSNLAVYNRSEEAIALTLSGSAEFLRLQGILAWQSGETAKAVSFFRQALAHDSNAWARSDRFFLSLINYDLHNLSAALELADPKLSLFFRADQQPQQVLSELDSKKFSSFSNADLEVKLVALNTLGRYEESLAALAPRNFLHNPVYGEPLFTQTGVWLMFWQAYALEQLGRKEESGVLLERILDFIAFSEKNGASRGYQTLAARCKLLLGKQDAAVALLEQSLANNTLSWYELQQRWWNPIRQTPGFHALQKEVHAHVNNEREKLGWEPVDWK
ncbi:MAG: hypothetical protein ABJL54_19080 [Halioglobus sp.]